MLSAVLRCISGTASVQLPHIVFYEKYRTATCHGELTPTRQDGDDIEAYV